MERPEPGQILERDGRQRKVVEVHGPDDCYTVVWKRPDNPYSAWRRSWCATWAEWVRGAKLVEAGKETE